MADNKETIIISVVEDKQATKKLRDSISAQLKDFPASIGEESFKKIRERIITNVKPKLEIDVNLNKLKGLDKKITAGIGEIKLGFDTGHVTQEIQKIKRLAQNNLGKFELDFKYSGNRLNTVATDIDKITASFDKAGIAKDKFAANVDQKVPQIINSFKQLKDVVAGVRQDLEKLDGTRIRILGPKEREKAAKTIAKEPEFSGAKSYDPKQLQEGQKELENTTKKTEQLTKATNEASKGISTFSERIGLTTARFGAYIVAAGGFYKILESFGTARTSVIEINKEINLLTQTLDGNARKASEVANSAFQIGVKYGQSGKELTKVASELARVGRGFGGGAGGFANSLELFAQSKLSIGFGDIGQTIEGTKNILSQFNRTGRDTAEVLDMIAGLSKKFDINAEELFTTVESGGAVFAQAGGNIKQFATIVTTIRQLTGLPATTIGNALNSITSRLQEPELRTFVDKFTNGGTRNPDGSLKGIYDQIIAIGRALKGLDNQTTTSIVAKIAGVRQGKVLEPLLRDIANGQQGLNELANVEKTINNSAGQLGRNAAIGVKSFDAQLESVAARFEEVFKNLAENKGIAHLVDEFASLTKSAATFVDVLGPILPTLIRLGTIKLGLSLVQGIPGFLRGFNQGEGSGGGALTRSSARKGNIYLPNGTAIAPETAGLLNSSVLSNGESVTPLVVNNKRAEAEKRIAQYQGLLQQNQFARDTYANQLHRVTERRNNLSGYVRDLTTATLNQALTPEQARRVATRNLLRDAAYEFVPSQSFDGPIQIQNFIKARTRELYNQSKGNNTNPSIAAKYILPFLTAEEQNKALAEAGQSGNLNKAIQNQAQPRSLARAARYQAEQEFAKKNPNALSGLEEETQRVLSQSIAQSRKHLYNILKEEGLTEETLSKAAKDYALILNKATVLEKALNQERELLRSEMHKEESVILSEIYNRAKNSERNSFGGRVSSFLFGDSEPEDHVTIGGRSLKKNILGRGANALGHGLRAIAPDLLLFGGGFALDAISQNADNSISPITDDSGNLVSNYQQVIARNRGAAQTSAITRGASGGLLTGGTIGSIFGPIGTLVGGGIGALAGGVYGNATSDAQDQITKQLLVAASQAQSAQQAGSILSNINNKQSLGGPIITGGGLSNFLFTPSTSAGQQLHNSIVDVTANSLTPLLSSDDPAVSFRKNLKSPEGRAFLQKFKEQALGIAANLTSQGKSAEDGDIVQALRAAYGNTKESVFQVGESFQELQGANKDFSKAIQEVTNKIKEFKNNPQGQANIINFASDFRRSSELIGNRNAIRDIGTQLFANQTSALNGRGTPFQVSSSLANVLAERFESGTRNLSPSLGIREQIDRSIGGIGAGFLSGSERSVFGDIGILRASVRPLAEEINRQTAGQDLTNDATIKALKNTLPTIIDKYFQGQVTSQLQTNEGRVEAETIRQKLNALTANPGQLQGDPTKLIESVFNEFGSNKDLLERFGKVIESVNSQIAQNSALYERERTVREHNLQLQTQTTSVAIRQIARRNATSLSDLSLAGDLGSLAGSLPRSVSSRSLTDALFAQNLAATRLGQSPNTISLQNDYAQASQKVIEAQDEYTRKLTLSNTALQAFEQTIQALKTSIDRQENGLSRLGSTPIGQRFQGRFQRGIYDTLSSSLFGQGGALNGVSNLTDLLKLGPEGFQKVAQQAALLTSNPAFLNAEQGVSSVFGNLQASNSPLGVTYNKQIQLLNTLAGAGESPADAKILFDTLSKYQQTGGATSSIEDQQLDELRKINTTLNIIAGNPLASSKFNNPNSPTANIPLTSQSTPDVFKFRPSDTSRKNRYIQQENNYAGGKLTDNAEADADRYGKNFHTTHNNSSIEFFASELNKILENFKNSQGQSTNIKVDTNLNVTGVDFSGKDTVTASIVTTLMQHFADQLSTNDPAEANLRAKLNTAIKTLQNK